MASRKSEDDTDTELLSPDDIEELVEGMANRSSDGGANPGGSSREKSSYKCCGTRVDPGVHKCSRCVEAGCAYGETKCKFH
jgi:hypothetical protein